MLFIVSIVSILLGTAVGIGPIGPSTSSGLIVANAGSSKSNALFVIPRCIQHEKRKTSYIAKPPNGLWRSQRNSQMYIEVMQSSFIVQGWYNSSYGQAQGTYPLIGVVSPSSRRQIAIGFTVLWINGIVDTNSTTTWNGYVDEKSNTIIANWTLVNVPRNANSTLFGYDTFVRM